MRRYKFFYLKSRNIFVSTLKLLTMTEWIEADLVSTTKTDRKINHKCNKLLTINVIGIENRMNASSFRY